MGKSLGNGGKEYEDERGIRVTPLGIKAWSLFSGHKLILPGKEEVQSSKSNLGQESYLRSFVLIL